MAALGLKPPPGGLFNKSTLVSKTGVPSSPVSTNPFADFGDFASPSTTTNANKVDDDFGVFTSPAVATSQKDPWGALDPFS